MSALYGDSIFESTIPLNVLAESIENDMKLFDNLIGESTEIITESVIDNLKKIIEGIKKFIKKIKDIISEAIRKIKNKAFYAALVTKWKVSLSRHSTPFTLRYLNYDGMKYFTEKLGIYIDEGKKFIDNIDTVSKDEIKDNDILLDSFKDMHGMGFIYVPERREYTFVRDIKIADDKEKEKFINEKLEKELKDSINVVSILEKEDKYMDKMWWATKQLANKIERKELDSERARKYKVLSDYLMGVSTLIERTIRVVKFIYSPVYKTA